MHKSRKKGFIKSYDLLVKRESLHHLKSLLHCFFTFARNIPNYRATALFFSLFTEFFLINRSL